MTTIEQQLRTIRFSYDQTVEDYLNDIHELDLLPEDFKRSATFRRFQTIAQQCNSGDPEIFDFLFPESGMRYMDIGSCANLLGYELHRWPSVYYGADLSIKLIHVTQEFVRQNHIPIGGLCVADASLLPFEDGFFEIAACIGVLEYYDVIYIKAALQELRRVLKKGGRAVIDFPNQDHTEFETMIQYEAYLGRPRFHLPSYADFQEAVKSLFHIDETDREALMIRYFVSK